MLRTNLLVHSHQAPTTLAALNFYQGTTPCILMIYKLVNDLLRFPIIVVYHRMYLFHDSNTDLHIVSSLPYLCYIANSPFLVSQSFPILINRTLPVAMRSRDCSE